MLMRAINAVGGVARQNEVTKMDGTMERIKSDKYYV